MDIKASQLDSTELKGLDVKHELDARPEGSLTTMKKRTARQKAPQQPRPVTADAAPKLRRGPRTDSEKLKQFRVGVLERLIEVFEQSNVPEHGRASFLASLTGKNRQTVTTWLRGQQLPDLQSFVTVALAFDLDMYYVLGITKAARRRVPGALPGVARRRSAVDSNGVALATMLDEQGVRWFTQAYSCDPAALMLRPMVGDSMAPDIDHNELIAIDTTVQAIEGDGIYALEKDKTLFVRRVEVHISGGYTLHARNSHYSAVRVEGAQGVAFRDMKILGRVPFVLKSAA